jgi:hypothetical protein
MPRRALIAVVVLAVAGLVPVRPAQADARADRAQLLLQIADVTDRQEQAESRVVAATLAEQQARRALRQARAGLRLWAVDAYVTGPRPDTPASRVYAEVAGARTTDTLASFRQQADRLSRVRSQAEEARDEARRQSAALASVRRRLDAAVAADDARRAAADAEADRARARANAAREAAVLLPAAGPLDPSALTPRHRRATEAQIQLMGRFDFGPGPTLPPGLRATGAVVEGVASWYGPGFHGRATASGAIYDQEGWTVASRELTLGTILWISRGDRHVLALVNDRGPYVDGRVLDLSHAVATQLGFSGIAQVRAEVVAPG